MLFKDKPKRYLALALFLVLGAGVLAGCNMPTIGLEAFISPSGIDGTPTPNWAATLEAAIPSTDVPGLAEDPVLVAQPELDVEPPPSPTPISTGPILYYTQAGDTINAIAVRFGVDVNEITSPESIPGTGFINPNQLLIIPNRLSNTTVATHVLPDSEFVYSLGTLDFDINAYVRNAGGYLDGYHEFLGSNGETYGGNVIRIIATDNSINPRLLLALLEYQGGWVTSEPSNLALRDYPLGLIDLNQKGLLRQMKWAVNQLSIGYYGWRV